MGIFFSQPVYYPPKKTVESVRRDIERQKADLVKFQGLRKRAQMGNVSNELRSELNMPRSWAYPTN